MASWNPSLVIWLWPRRPARQTGRWWTEEGNQVPFLTQGWPICPSFLLVQMSEGEMTIIFKKLCLKLIMPEIKPCILGPSIASFQQCRSLDQRSYTRDHLNIRSWEKRPPKNVFNFILEECWDFDFLPSVPKYCPLAPGVCIPDPQQPCPPLQRFTETWTLSLGLFVCLFVWICWCDWVFVLLCVWDTVCVWEYGVEYGVWNTGSCCTSHLHMNYQHQIFSIHIHVTFTKCILQKAPQQRKLKRRQEAVTLRTPFQKEKQSSQLICVK